MPSPEEISIFQHQLLEWAECNLRSFPWRQTTSPYNVLIAEVLLQRTRADLVEPVYEELIDEYPNFVALSKANQDCLLAIVRPLGLQNTRVQALTSIADALAGQAVPDTEEELLEIPYVGKYAANATLCFAFGQARPIVDANVVRVYGRFFGLNLNYEMEITWNFAACLVPEENARQFNLGLLDFAAKICTSSPKCHRCFLSDICHYYSRN